MRKTLILAAVALPLAACATNPYGYGYGNNNPYGTLGTIGALGGAYGTNMSQAAASTCANYASRYGRVSVNNVRQLDANLVKVGGYVSRGYRNEGWDCTFRSDGRVVDFDL